jgi:hypothetical protein
MGLFGDLDIASANDDPFSVPDDKYKVVVISAEVAKSNAGNIGLKIGYSITEGAYAGNSSLQTWNEIPNKLSDSEYGMLLDEEKGKYEQKKSFLKKTMLDLGIPESRINSVDPGDLIGLTAIATVKNKSGSPYKSVYLSPAKPGEVSVGGGGLGTSTKNPFDD